MSASASKPAKKPAKPPISDGMVLTAAAIRAICRIGRGQSAGTHPRKAAYAAINRIHAIPGEVDKGALHPGEAALEMLRIEISLKSVAPAPATVPAAVNPTKKRRNG